MRKRIIIFLIICGFLLLITPVGAEEITDIDDIEKAGTYLIEIVTIDSEGNEIVETIWITVVFDRTVVEVEKGEGIDANDILKYFKPRSIF